MEPSSSVDDRTIIFRLLDHRGVKMQRFAELIGYSYDYVHSIRTGRRPVTEEFRRRCADYFQMPESLLFVSSVWTEDHEPQSSAPSGEPPAASARLSTPGQYVDTPQGQESHSGASEGDSRAVA